MSWLQAFSAMCNPSSPSNLRKWIPKVPARGSANFSYKEPDTKYFSLSVPYSLCHNYSTLLLLQKQSETKCKLIDMLYSNKTLFINAGGRPDLAHRPYLQTPVWDPWKTLLDLSIQEHSDCGFFTILSKCWKGYTGGNLARPLPLNMGLEEVLKRKGANWPANLTSLPLHSLL